MAGFSTNNPNDYLCFGHQPGKDTEASTFYFLRHLNGSGFDTTPQVQSVREGGDGQEVGLRYKTMVKTDGQMIAYARPEVTGRLLTAALGLDTPAAGPTTPLTDHTISPVATLPYLTIEQKYADERERTTNCKVASLDIDWQAGGPLQLTAAFSSGGTSYRPTDAAKTPVRESGDPLMWPGASVTLGGGASGCKVTKGKVAIKRGMDDTVQTLSLNREDLVELTQDYEVDLTIKYENAALWEYAQYAGAGGTVVPQDLATTSIDLFTQQGSQSLRLVAPMLQVADTKLNRLDPDGKTMYYNLTCQSVLGATNPLFAVVRSTATAAF